MLTLQRLMSRRVDAAPRLSSVCVGDKNTTFRMSLYRYVLLAVAAAAAPRRARAPEAEAAVGVPAPATIINITHFQPAHYHNIFQ